MFKKNTSSDSKSIQFNIKERFRQLRTNIEYSSFNKDIQVVSVTSSNPKEGKSTVSSNLAKVSAAKYDKVLLIDCDLRKPVQHTLFHASNKMGLSNLMKNMKEIDVHNEEYFKKFKSEDCGTVYLLTSGQTVPNPQELLSSNRFKELLEDLKKQFDFIIIDCPPLNAVADAIPIASVVDGTIFVVSAKDTDKREAKQALTMLQRGGAKVLGAVLTKADATVHKYYKYNYTYGE